MISGSYLTHQFQLFDLAMLCMLVDPARKRLARRTFARVLQKRMSNLLVFRPCFLLWMILVLPGQPASGQRYPFLPVPGAPKAAKKLFQDSRGRLWLVGSDLAFFDGSRFFFLRDYGFPHVTTYDVTEDKNGAIWIAAKTGVYRFWNGTVQQVSSGAAVSVVAATPTLVIAVMGPIAEGVPIDASLFRIEKAGGAWKTDRVMSLYSPGPLSLDRNDALLYPWPGRGWNELRLRDVVRWQPGMRIVAVHHPEPNSPVKAPMRVMRDHLGCVWLGGSDTNIYDCGGGGHTLTFEGAQPRASLRETPQGAMLLTGQNSLALGRPGSFQVATPANGLPNLADAIATRDGTIWLSGSDGLYRFPSPFRLEYWTVREGLSSAPWSLARTRGKVFAGFDQRIEVLTTDRDRWETMTKFTNGGIVSGLLGKQDGTLLAALHNGGVAQLGADGRVLARTARDDSKSVSMRLLQIPAPPGRPNDEEVWLGGSSLGRLTRQGNVLKLAV
ncbi:MAG TPA: hypothetical protein VK604_06630, partial [Bryobacteraceae bacterium]|nr:hypothetical protein [Bryobacteraceae bacterium]